MKKRKRRRRKKKRCTVLKSWYKSGPDFAGGGPGPTLRMDLY